MADQHISTIYTYDGQYCLDADGQDAVPGGRVILWACDGNDHYQQWLAFSYPSYLGDLLFQPGTVRGVYELQNVGSGLCLSESQDARSIIQDNCLYDEAHRFWVDYARAFGTWHHRAAEYVWRRP